MSSPSPPQLSSEEEQELLRIARATLREYLVTGAIPPGKPHKPSLTRDAACFVSLTTGEGQLRGCSGTLAATTPLHHCVQEVAVRTATRDTRFPQVTAEELESIEIEISVLSALERVAAPDQVDVGTHGILVTHGPHHAVFLPQVPGPRGWDRETYLAQCCRKAGLPDGAWQHRETTIDVFTARIFSESDFEGVAAGE